MKKLHRSGRYLWNAICSINIEENFEINKEDIFWNKKELWNTKWNRKIFNKTPPPQKLNKIMVGWDVSWMFWYEVFYYFFKRFNL